MRHRMLGVACACAVTLALACAKGNNTNAEGSVEASPAATPAPAAEAPPAALSLADVAGKWNVRAVPESGDTTPTTYVLTATADTTGWSIKFPSGLVVPLHVSVSGDSIVSSTGTFASQRRKGLKVVSNTVLRKQGDKLVGETVAHYKVTTPDSVLRLRTEGARAP